MSKPLNELLSMVMRSGAAGPDVTQISRNIFFARAQRLIVQAKMEQEELERQLKLLTRKP